MFTNDSEEITSLLSEDSESATPTPLTTAPLKYANEWAKGIEVELIDDKGSVGYVQLVT